MNIEIETVRAVARVIKRRFPNLTTDETLELAGDILKAIENPTGGEHGTR